MQAWPSLTMQLAVAALSTILLCASNFVLAAPSLGIFQSTSISQVFPLNFSSNNTSVVLLPTAVYEEYKIPNTHLTLHLTLLGTLGRDAMEACLTSLTSWLSAMRQSANMPTRDFHWKDPAGAAFFIESLSKRLTWQNVSDVLQGLRGDLYNEKRYFQSIFSVEDQQTGQFIGQGHLWEYNPPLPTGVAAISASTS